MMTMKTAVVVLADPKGHDLLFDNPVGNCGAAQPREICRRGLPDPYLLTGADR